jgi:hypothetical protein
VTVEFSITIEPRLEVILVVVLKLEPDPIPDPPTAPAMLFAVTNEFRISIPEIVDDPLVNEPPPIPEPPVALEFERVLALTHETTIRIKPVIDAPVETDPVPIPEAACQVSELLLAVTVEFQIKTPLSIA